MKRYVIIGNGVAGATALDQIRRIDPLAKITVFTQESHPFYYRPRLPEFLAGEVPLEKFTMRSLKDYQDWGVDLHFSEKIERVDPTSKIVWSDKGASFGYDALLLATGASANMPPIKGSEKKGVFTLRTVEDAQSLRQAAHICQQAILVGGGLLGLEAGHGLIKLGLKVQVVEFFDRLMPRQMDTAGAAILQAMLEKMGFSFHLGASAQEIVGGEQVEGLQLKDGRVLPGGLVLCSAGISPNLELGRQLEAISSLRVNKAIVVDEFMHTGVDDVWAAGDVAEYNGLPGGIWPSAMEQGRIAGLNMSGEAKAYQPKAPSTSLKVAGIQLTSAGDIDADNKQTASVVRGDNYYRKIVVANNLIKGIIFLGDNKGVRQCVDAMNAARPLGELAALLDDPDFDFDRLK